MASVKLPRDFLWGFATASYQIEGSTDVDGRLPSIWDEFCKIPGKIADGSSGDVACDSYRQTDQDVALLRQLGAKVYRFSISWSRIIPHGGRHDEVNQRGIDHYVRLVDALIENEITPMVTLLHWDVPNTLEERYGGYLNKDEFVADYTHYATIMFEALGSKVKHWITFNEPFCSAILGYNIGVFAPGRTSDRSKSSAGDGTTEPWIVGNTILVAHGSAVKVYRDQFKARDGGEIGITLNGDYAYPYDSDSRADIEAVERRLEFAISWFADPIYFGHYPESMRKQLGDRLPRLSAAEVDLVRGSNDFYGMNTYCAHFIRANTEDASPEDFAGNLEILFHNKDGHPVGPETQAAWMRPNAPGFRKLLKWLSDRYGRPKIYVTENGTSVKGENDLAKEAILEDDFRVEYFQSYIKAMAEAYSEDTVDVRAYMAWSLMDNFEWADGYETRFGVTYVDYTDPKRGRIPKKSAKMMKEIFNQYIETASS